MRLKKYSASVLVRGKPGYRQCNICLSTEMEVEIGKKENKVKKKYNPKWEQLLRGQVSFKHQKKWPGLQAAFG